MNSPSVSHGSPQPKPNELPPYVAEFYGIAQPSGIVRDYNNKLNGHWTIVTSLPRQSFEGFQTWGLMVIEQLACLPPYRAYLEKRWLTAATEKQLKERAAEHGQPPHKPSIDDFINPRTQAAVAALETSAVFIHSRMRSFLQQPDPKLLAVALDAALDAHRRFATEVEYQHTLRVAENSTTPETLQSLKSIAIDKATREALLGKSWAATGAAIYASQDRDPTFSEPAFEQQIPSIIRSLL